MTEEYCSGDGRSRATVTPQLPGLLAPARRWRLAVLAAIGALQSGAAIGLAWWLQQVLRARARGAGSQAEQDASALTTWIRDAAAGGALEQLALVLGTLGWVGAIAWLRRRERIDAEALGHSYVNDLRSQLLDKLVRFDLHERVRVSRGAVIVRFISDLTALRQWVSLGIARLLVSGLTVLITLPAFALISPGMALVAGVALALSTVWLVGLGPALREAARRVRRQRAKLAADVADRVAALPTIQACGQVTRERKRLLRRAEQLAQESIARAHVVGTARAAAESGTLLAMVGVVLTAALLSSSSVADGATVVSALAVIGVLNGSFSQLARVYEYWQGAQVARQKILNFLASPASLPSPGASSSRAPSRPAPAPQLAFEQVHVEGLIPSLSWRPPTGELTALVGANGAGKSTLLAMAGGLLTPDGGAVTLNGESVMALSERIRAGAIGMVSSEAPLLRGSILRNVRYRHPKASLGDVWDVLEQCGLSGWVESLDKGLDTRLSEGGSNLSLGQRQRLLLARALLGNPPLLLLDEFDANLDPPTWAHCFEVIQSYPGTRLMVTHREDSARAADHLVLLRDGRIGAEGTPIDLSRHDEPLLAHLGNSTNVVSWRCSA